MTVQQPNARRLTKPLAGLAVLALFVASSGASCQRPLFSNPFGQPLPAAPQVLLDGASRDQIIAAVNQQSARIRSINATGASITIPGTMGLPILSGNIAAERPGRFRLTAGTSLSGQELDVGSNDVLFWMWVRRNPPPAIYFCRHAQFANSNIRQMMPIEPAWLLAALGIVDIDPASVYDVQPPRRDGKVEIRSWLASASGTLHRIMVVEARRAVVTEQYVYDASGKTLLASAVAETQRYYPAEQVTLPDRLSLEMPTANLKLKIDLGTVVINQPAADPRQLWTMPTFQGYQQFDLGGAIPGTPLPGQPQPPPPAIQPYLPQPSTQPYLPQQPATAPYQPSPTAPYTGQPTTMMNGSPGVGNDAARGVLPASYASDSYWPAGSTPANYPPPNSPEARPPIGDYFVR